MADAQLASPSSEVGGALPVSTPLEETNSDLLVKLEREKLQDSDERMVGEKEQKSEKVNIEGEEKSETVEEGVEKMEVDNVEAGSPVDVKKGESEEGAKDEEKMEVDEKGVEPRKEVLEKAAEPETGEKEGSEQKEEGKKKEMPERVVHEETDADVELKEEPDPVVLASRRPLKIDESIGELEKTYGVLMLEKIIGLLSAILPQDMTVSGWVVGGA